MNLSLNVQMTPTPASPSADVAPAFDALALPFPLVIATDAALPVQEVAPLPEAAPPADTPDLASPDIAVEQAALPDALLAAMTPPLVAATLPAMMLAMPTPKTLVAAEAPAPAANDGAPALAPVAAPLRMPDAAPVAARVDSAVKPPAPDAASPEPTAADTNPDTAPAGVAASAAQAATPRGADRLQLAGPPTAWRQTLHDALGERLQLQLGRGSEQATIRLEPPQLGRIDIAIRHSGGNLEVHIAASNGEVLRQLNLVTDNLRNDLAGRQYANVSVSVSETPRTQASMQAGQQPSGQPDAQGRQHAGQDQQQQQRRTPGLALHDAGAATSLFSLNARE